MQIGIDASRALRAHSTGTEFYAAEILRHLLALPQAGQHQWRLYVDAGDVPDHFPQPVTLAPSESVQFLERHLGISSSAIHGQPEIRLLPRRRMWTHRSLRAEITGHPPDVLFVPAHVIPFAPPWQQLPPSVVTIHDLGYHYFPQAHTLGQRLYLRASTRWSTAVAARVLAVSAATALDLQHHCGVSPRKIRVVHEAPPTQAPPHTQAQGRGGLDGAAALSSHFGLTQPYGLYIGTIQPRKNLVRLLRAYARLKEEHGIEWHLVLAGKLGWLSHSIYQTADELGLDGCVHFLGYVDDAWKSVLLEHALMFCYPSLFEGFGLPVLEAQQRGIPVMTSNNSALPEIAGDAALLVDPLDEAALAQAMLRLSRDDSLREQLIAAGYENLKRFSWEKAAAETLAVLEEAAASRS